MFNFDAFCKGMKYFRKKNEQTLDSLSEAVGVNSKYLQAIEVGREKPSLKLCVNLVNELGVSIEDCLKSDYEIDQVLYKQFRARLGKYSDNEKMLLKSIIYVTNGKEGNMDGIQ